MNFHLFENLSQADAEQFLTHFLSAEGNAIDQTIALVHSEGLSLRLGTSSIKPMFLWVLGKLKSNPKAPDPTAPSWIAETDTYKRGLFAFDEPSNVLVLRTAYFLGECFIKDFPFLRWGTGDPQTALKRMPVVKGFKANIEMPPIMVTENLMRRIHGKGAPTSIIDVAVETWVSKI